MALPWMPVYCAETVFETAHLSAAETGGYLLLTLHYWRDGSLPDDDRALARLARMTGAQWRKSKAAIAALFNDGWRHDRIDAERKGAVDVSEKRAAAGRLGAEARAAKSSGAPDLLKQTSSPASTNAKPGHTHLQSHSQSQERVRGAPARGISFPGDFELTPEDRAFGTAEGLSEDEMTRAVSDLRLWAAERGAMRLDWHATARRFMRQAASRKPAINLSASQTLPQSGAAPIMVYVKRDTPQWEAWVSFWRRTKGKSPPSSRKGGWWFQTEWPPLAPEWREAA